MRPPTKPTCTSPMDTVAPYPKPRRPAPVCRFLPEHTNAVSLLDRLLHHAVVIATCGTQSCS
jgi:hypothetical protein